MEDFGKSRFWTMESYLGREGREDRRRLLHRDTVEVAVSGLNVSMESKQENWEQVNRGSERMRGW